MITTKNKIKIIGLNQFPVSNPIALLCSTDGFGFVQDCLTMQLDFSMFTG